MAESNEARSTRGVKEREEFTALSKPLATSGRAVTRRGFGEVLQLIDKLVEQLDSENAQPATASKAFEAMMTKSHSLQTGVTNTLVTQNWWASATHTGLHQSMKFALDTAVKAMYVIGSAMRQDQQTVIGKVSLEDKEMVTHAKHVLADVKKMLERALEMDEDNWTRENNA